MASNAILFITFAFINSICISLAFDPRPLLDFCVADPTGNGACKDRNTVTVDDFVFSGLSQPTNTSNYYGFSFILLNAATMPGFNTLGLSFARVDFAANGFIPPHTHPRASEIIYVMEGMIEVGFVTTYPEYKYYSKILNEGDLIIIPFGLVHTVRNVARGNSVMTASFNSQNPGFVFFHSAFAAKPAIDRGYLARSFKLRARTVKDLQTQPWL